MDDRDLKKIFWGIIFILYIIFSIHSELKPSSSTYHYTTSTTTENKHCIYPGCEKTKAPNSQYCHSHMYNHPTYAEREAAKKNSDSDSSYQNSSSNAYDDGYDSVMDDEDYDWDRYQSDDDYAEGVDDAEDDLDW